MMITNAGRRIVTPGDVEAMRLRFVAGDHAGVLALDADLRRDGHWDAPPGVSRAALNERMNFFATRSRDGIEDHGGLPSLLNDSGEFDGR